MIIVTPQEFVAQNNASALFPDVDYIVDCRGAIFDAHDLYQLAFDLADGEPTVGAVNAAGRKLSIAMSHAAELREKAAKLFGDVVVVNDPLGEFEWKGSISLRHKGRGFNPVVQHGTGHDVFQVGHIYLDRPERTMDGLSWYLSSLGYRVAVEDNPAAIL